MFAARALLRVPLAAPSLRASAPAVRLMRTSAALRASGPPIIQGKGAATGSVPTDEEQATGLERFELEHKLAGQDAFDMTPLQADRMGTTKEPIKVLSYVSLAMRRGSERGLAAVGADEERFDSSRRASSAARARLPARTTLCEFSSRLHGSTEHGR